MILAFPSGLPLSTSWLLCLLFSRATPLSNADFRKLLETPRAERGTPRSQQSRPAAKPKAEGDNDQKAKKTQYRPKAKPKGEDDEDEDPDKTNYR